MSDSILVVEDYDDLRSAVVSVLSRAHYACDAVASSQDALVKLREHDYAVVLLSTRMPITEDPVVQYLAHSLHGGTRVILMTEPEQPTANFHALLKPFDPAALLAEIEAP